MTTEFTDEVDLAAEALGGAVLAASDDFFAEKENLLRAHAPEWRAEAYTDRGKWMDGWESRRKRVPGHDWAIVRLGLAGVVRGVVVDTSFFRGNYPAECALEGCFARSDARLDDLLADGTEWFEILPKVGLAGDARNAFPVTDPRAVSHLRLRIFPDGGVARLRVHGRVLPDWRALGGAAVPVDLAALETGARVLACSDMFFGPKHNLILPGRAVNMGGGWETKRRRGPGHDWVEVELAGPGTLTRVEVDTNHFKGNYPDTCSIDACAEGGAWRELLPRTKLMEHTRHFFVEELGDVGEVTRVRLNVYPDGGVSRLRVWGTLSARGRAAAGLARLNALTRARAERELLRCCASPAWAADVAAALPLATREALMDAAERAADALGPDQWRAAFAAHPRIGDVARARGWSRDEQHGVAGADAATLAALADENRAYEARFGFVFLVCATGKTAAEMLDLLRARAGNAAADELRNAAAEQRKITRLRLEKLVAV